MIETLSLARRHVGHDLVINKGASIGVVTDRDSGGGRAKVLHAEHGVSNVGTRDVWEVHVGSIDRSFVVADRTQRSIDMVRIGAQSHRLIAGQDDRVYAVG